MKFETRTRWIHISELTTDHDVVGLGPVVHIVRDGNLVRVTSIFGIGKTYNSGTDIELYEGVFDESGQRISMTSEEYRAHIYSGQQIGP